MRFGDGAKGSTVKDRRRDGPDMEHHHASTTEPLKWSASEEAKYLYVCEWMKWNLAVLDEMKNEFGRRAKENMNGVKMLFNW